MELKKGYTLRKRYQETIDTEIKAGYVDEVKQTELSNTRDKFQ